MSDIGLMMMLGAEQEHLPRLLESVRDVADPARSTVMVLNGIGPRDETEIIAREWGADVHGCTWRDFGSNLTELVSLAQRRAGDGYLLHVGATDTVTRHGDLPELGEPCYMLLHRKDKWLFRMPALIGVGRRAWRFVGPVHSYLDPVEKVHPLDALEVTLHDDDGRRDEKIARYRAILEKAVASNPSDARSTYYLAQSLENLGEHAQARQLYSKRSHMGGFEEEAWHAEYIAALIYSWHDDFNLGAEMLLAAWRRRPHRAEPLRALARAANARADQLAFPPLDVVNVESEAYVA